jgi:phosphocarrier protein
VSDPHRHEAEFVVGSELGLHARPAGQFVLLAERFESEIQVGRGEEWVDGRSVLSLLSLAASKGTRLCVRAEGPDARAAVEALGALLEGGARAAV